MTGLRSDELVAAIQRDRTRCRTQRLDILVVTVLGVVLGATAIGISVFSDAFGADTTLSGFVELLTVNAAWLFFSLFALVGLFVAYPAHTLLRGHHGFTNPRTTFLGVLLSRIALVGTALLVAFVIPLFVGVLAFESFSLPVFFGVVALSVLAISAYTAVGVSLAAVARSDTRLVLWLLGFYWVVVFLWETSVVPLVVAFATGADPETVIGTPPTVHDVLLAMSPGGAHATLSETLLSGGAGVIDLVAALSLLGWLVVPPLGALVWRTRRR